MSREWLEVTTDLLLFVVISRVRAQGELGIKVALMDACMIHDREIQRTKIDQTPNLVLLQRTVKSPQA